MLHPIAWSGSSIAHPGRNRVAQRSRIPGTPKIGVPDGRCIFEPAGRTRPDLAGSVVNFDNFVLIDPAFNTQTTTL